MWYSKQKQIFATIFQALICYHIFKVFHFFLLVLLSGVHEGLKAFIYYNQVVPNIWMKKWSWKKMVLKYFLTETIHAQENASRGSYFEIFLISNFLKGLTCIALNECEKSHKSLPLTFIGQIEILSKIDWLSHSCSVTGHCWWLGQYDTLLDLICCTSLSLYLSFSEYLDLSS